MASANFKSPRYVILLDPDQDTRLDKDPEYLKYLEQKAEEELMMRMLEKNLEPC